MAKARDESHVSGLEVRQQKLPLSWRGDGAPKTEAAPPAAEPGPPPAAAEADATLTPAEPTPAEPTSTAADAEAAPAVPTSTADDAEAAPAAPADPGPEAPAGFTLLVANPCSPRPLAAPRVLPDRNPPV